MQKSIKIANRTVGGGEPAFLIAEIAQAHDGSLGMAHAYVDAVAESGADAIKFQTHMAEFESSRDDLFRVNFSRQDATRYDYWKRMEFTPEQWKDLANHAREKGLIFLSSAFCVEAVELLRGIGMPAWKVGSGEFFSDDVLEAMAQDGKPILLSTGMASSEEIAARANWLRGFGAPLALFQCTSKYPSAPKDVGLNVLDAFRESHGCPIGLSDHSGTIFPGLAAMAQGADLIEVHVVFDKRMSGPDTAASVTLEDLSVLAEARDWFGEMMKHPVDKTQLPESLNKTRQLFTKSVALRKSLPAGTVLTEEHLTPKKPGTGIPWDERRSLAGKKLAADVPNDRLLRMEDLVPQ